MTIPQQNRLDIWVPESDNADRLLYTIEQNVTRNGGKVYGCALTPKGWNLFGCASEAVLMGLEKFATEHGFKVDRAGETMQQLMDEAMEQKA